MTHMYIQFQFESGSQMLQLLSSFFEGTNDGRATLRHGRVRERCLGRFMLKTVLFIFHS